MEKSKRYHFTSSDNFFKIIMRRELLLFNAFSMKDKNEIVSGLNLATKSLNIVCSRYEDSNLSESAKKAKNHIINKIKDIEKNESSLQNEYYFYILSLCKDIKNKYLWDNYALNSTGFALEFNEDEIKSNICPYNENRFEYEAINWGVKEQFVPYMTGFINNEPIKNVIYDEDEYVNNLANILYDRFSTSDKKETDCTSWILFLIFSSSASYKHKDYSPERETRLFFSLSHTAINYNLTSFFSNYFYDIEKLIMDERKYIPLHLNPLGKTSHNDENKHKIIMSGKYPFATLNKVIIGNKNKSSVDEIKNLLTRNNFHDVFVEKIE